MEWEPDSFTREISRILHSQKKLLKDPFYQSKTEPQRSTEIESKINQAKKAEEIISQLIEASAPATLSSPSASPGLKPTATSEQAPDIVKHKIETQDYDDFLDKQEYDYDWLNKRIVVDLNLYLSAKKAFNESIENLGEYSWPVETISPDKFFVNIERRFGFFRDEISKYKEDREKIDNILNDPPGYVVFINTLNNYLDKIDSATSENVKLRRSKMEIPVFTPSPYLPSPARSSVAPAPASTPTPAPAPAPAPASISQVKTETTTTPTTTTTTTTVVPTSTVKDEDLIWADMTDVTDDESGGSEIAQKLINNINRKIFGGSHKYKK